MHSSLEINHGSIMLNDELDDFIDSTFESEGAERISMKIIENLSDIWIPSHLLNKRRRVSHPNLKKPAIFRTLEKTYVNSFSVYDENDDQTKNCGSKDSVNSIKSSESYRSSTSQKGAISSESSGNNSEDSDDTFIKKNFKAKSQEAPIDNCVAQLKGSSPTDMLNESVMKYVDESEVDDVLVNFPVAYKRPDIKISGKKQKNQKKKKNAQKKNVLDVFSQKDSDCSYPVRDEFYESVMRQSRKHDQKYECEYPSLNTENKQVNNKKAPELKEFKKVEVLTKDNESAPMSSKKSTNSNLETTGVIIVIENLPKSISKEEVYDLLQIGEIKSLKSSKCGQFKVAEMRMESDSDAEWIIDCFNGNAAFGVGSSVLKCYKAS